LSLILRPADKKKKQAGEQETSSLKEQS